MIKFTKLIAASALIASASTAALAQDEDPGNNGVGVGVGVEGNASEQAPGADVSAGVAGESDVNYGSIISSLRTSGVTAADIEGLEAGAEIQVVTLADVQGNAAENASALDEAVSSLETSIGEIRTALGANADVTAALEAEGYTADDVVAVTTTADGGLTVIVDDSM